MPDTDQVDTGQIDDRIDLRFHWRTTELTRVLLVSAAAALAAALISGQWALIAFAAPLLGVLSSLHWQRPVPPMSVRCTPDTLRCFEGDREQIAVELTGGGALSGSSEGEAVTLAVTAPDGMTVELLDSAQPQRSDVALTAERWGRYPLTARVDVVASGGLLAGSASAPVGQSFVFPLVPPPSTAMPRTEMLDRIGTHLTRHVGPGVEYADIRAYVPGDQLRTVNWSVSARRGVLHVTQRLTDRSLDVVVLVDLSAQPPGPATAATQRAAEGALQVVQSALRSGDRAGVIGLGGQQPRWLGADIGQRQFYRILDAVLGAGADFRSVDGTLAPRVAVPPGAVIIAFSTLLDAAFGLALMDLSQRGHVVVAVDVLQGCPLGDDEDPILQRMWGLQRAAMYRDMRMVGVEVVDWPADLTLDVAMRLLPQVRVRSARRRR
ncbi:DUF58 domain-containing protein [Mycolicibacterium sp.]|uniref:DUF58 domain-containing protein n=1 Tax=Mycolicibacterium sp. TaxID=2320850 RepID=UPI0028ACE07C|nr:DUF58 domain-containing protein [Mycolicibacterium sp.]